MHGKRTDDEHGLLRVLIPLPHDEWHGQSSETVWVEPIGDGVFRIRNVPFYARNLSFGDVISAREAANSALTLDKVVSRGGHSTYRIRLADSVSLEDLTFDKYWQPLEAAGCTYERATERLLGVDVPPAAGIYEVYDLLSTGENEGAWSFEEGHCGHHLG